MSAKGTLPAITDETAAIEGAVPRPAMNNAADSPQNPDTTTARPIPSTMTRSRRASDHRPMGRCPIASPPIREPIAEMASTNPPSREPSPNQATTAASIAAREPIRSSEATVISATEGLSSTFPNFPVAVGIRSPRTAGSRRNSNAPTSWIAATIRSAVMVPTEATRAVIRTGPSTQMISCRAASRLNRGVTRCCGTSCG